MVIAMVENHGFLVCYGRMDDKQTGSVQVALDKAKSAALYRPPAKASEDGIAKGRVALLGLAGATPIQGGVPMMVGAGVIGGIRVRGANSDRAAAAAMAGSGGHPAETRDDDRRTAPCWAPLNANVCFSKA